MRTPQPMSFWILGAEKPKSKRDALLGVLVDFQSKIHFAIHLDFRCWWFFNPKITQYAAARSTHTVAAETSSSGPAIQQSFCILARKPF